MSSRAMSCPSCGGLLAPRDGDSRGTCGSCGTPYARTDQIPRYILPCPTDGTEVLRTVRKVLSGRDARRGALEGSRVSRPLLFHVPFWHVSAQISGLVLGLEPEYREEEVPVVVESENSEGVQSFPGLTRKVRSRCGARAARRESRAWSSLNITAADLEPLGLPNLSEDSQLAVTGLEIQRSSLPAGLEVLDGRLTGMGTVVDPSVTLSEAIARSDKYFMRIALGVGRGLEQRWSWNAITARRACLVYYPIWMVDFEFAGRTYKAVIDGVSGRIVRGRFPGRHLDAGIIATVIAVFWAAIIPPTIASMLFLDRTILMHDGGRPGCTPVILLLLAVLAMSTWKFLKLLDGTGGRGGDLVL